MSARLKLTLAYDGRLFAGWQSQRHGNTVQDRLEAAITRVLGKQLRIHGAGRTDAGVHALGQCAHVDLPDRDRSPNEWQKILNALLPPQVCVMRARYVPQSFHARFSAKAKIYRYRIWTGPILPPFEVGRVWHVTQPIDFARIRRAAKLFVGTHDFSGFAGNRGKLEASTVRTIQRATAKKSQKLVVVEFSGEGFLYKMVRMMVGALVEHGTGKIPLGGIRDRLGSKSRGTGPRFVAPAEGLILVAIRY
jgi:tRNA pseudouridine38-40 synthase